MKNNILRAKFPWSLCICPISCPTMLPAGQSGFYIALFTKWDSVFFSIWKRYFDSFLARLIVCLGRIFLSLSQAASSNWFHRMTLLSGGAYLLKPGAALDQVYNKDNDEQKKTDTRTKFAIISFFPPKVAWKVTGSTGRPWRKIQQLISGTSHSSFIVVSRVSLYTKN